MRARTIPSISGNVVLVLAMAVTGCDRLKGNDPTDMKAQTELKREQAACGSASAGDRLKNIIFDQAIAKRNGDRTNLDVLADYSVARLQDPVVKGRDRSFDVTRCKGRFILDVPPGAERGLGGDRQLQADIDYTAQASADGAGFVYQQKGAEPIVARLAAFNLQAGAYRPPPAIDYTQAPPEVAEQSTFIQPKPTAPPPSTPAEPTVPADRRSRSAPLNPIPYRRVADQTSSEPRQPAPTSGRSADAEATVRAFYAALGAGNGKAASSKVIPEKRSSGAFSPGAISRFYGQLPEPLKLTAIVPVAGGAFRVTYRYSAGRSRCNGSAVVRLTNRGGRNLIRSIQALTGC